VQNRGERTETSIPTTLVRLICPKVHLEYANNSGDGRSQDIGHLNSADVLQMLDPQLLLRYTYKTYIATSRFESLWLNWNSVSIHPRQFTCNFFNSR
jgi:hypothetical protein